MKYRLSRIIPMRFISTYGGYVNCDMPKEHPDYVKTTVWWQWRDRILRQKDIACLMV